MRHRRLLRLESSNEPTNMRQVCLPRTILFGQSVNPQVGNLLTASHRRLRLLGRHMPTPSARIVFEVHLSGNIGSPGDGHVSSAAA